MTNETDKSSDFNIVKCRAKARTPNELVDCLTPEHAHICNVSLAFGSIYFCNHPRRNEIIENTKKLQGKSDDAAKQPLD